jgi:hypothetical protein
MAEHHRAGAVRGRDVAHLRPAAHERADGRDEAGRARGRDTPAASSARGTAEPRDWEGPVLENIGSFTFSPSSTYLFLKRRAANDTFFDHDLRDAPAPKWLSDGVPYLKKHDK